MSTDPPGQLALLYERTRDAMVAFELAQIHEKAGATVDAVQWYTTASERFRRAQWKQKADECLTRLGAPIPVAPVPTSVRETSGEMNNVSIGQTDTPSDAQEETRSESIIIEFEEQQGPQPGASLEGGPETAFEQPIEGAAVASPGADAGLGRRRKRRGRRGGRGRNKGTRPGVATTMAASPISSAAVPTTPPSMFDRVATTPAPAAAQASLSEQFSAVRTFQTESSGSGHAAPASSGLQMRGRAGDPGLSSRLTQFESQLRRLLACAVHSVEQADEAPAGPGVFLITDTDQTCYYYVEACQTLRVGIGNLIRSGRSSREGANLKEKLAEHLGINDSRVAKYLKENCVVRWLQLDEGAPLLAHFAIAVLRPVANE